jgi:ADP-L-glycero-D-manno-heptose 6-epimerase
MSKLIVVTGAAGFIGCNLAKKLNEQGEEHLVLVDHFDVPAKQINLEGIKYHAKVDRDMFHEWLSEHADDVSIVYHLGARTDTTELNFRVLDSLNLSYTKAIWEICTGKHIPLLYASSAATYGLGEYGFSDSMAEIDLLKPLNPYGVSKQLFDIFASQEKQTPPSWIGLKFFNVYGPWEFHKSRMASVVMHAYRQIKETGKVKLFKSHRDDYKDGEQMRDFIYVNDVVDVCLYWGQRMLRGDAELPSGIYNLGTGTARSFNDLATAIFSALSAKPQIEYLDTPADIRDKYQYYTQADMHKLRQAGYTKAFTNLEDGVQLYVDFLEANR